MSSERDYYVSVKKLREDRSKVGIAVFGVDSSRGNPGDESQVTCEACQDPDVQKQRLEDSSSPKCLPFDILKIH